MGLNKTIARILSILTSPEGLDISITNLVKIIKIKYGTGSYPLVNKQLHKMANQRLIFLDKIGQTLIARLNLEDQNLNSLLTEMEINNKIIIENKPRLKPIISEINITCKKFHFIHSISIINVEENISLNRIEFLVIFKPKILDNSWSPAHDLFLIQEKNNIIELFRILAKQYNIRIDYLILERKEFLELLLSDEINQVKEMIKRKITIFNPEVFWDDIKDIFQDYLKRIKHQDTKNFETNPNFISTQELEYNLAKFGYIEFGSTIKKSKDIAIEYIITSILLKDDLRKIESIPILILKNINIINIELLTFLCTKYGVIDRLLNIFDPYKLINNKLIEKSKLYNVLPTTNDQ